MIELVVVLTVKPECIAETEQLLTPLVEASRKDAGNVFYNCNTVANRNGTFVFREAWQDQAALDKHMEQKHLIDFLDKIKDLAIGDLTSYPMGKPLA